MTHDKGNQHKSWRYVSTSSCKTSFLWQTLLSWGGYKKKGITVWYLNVATPLLQYMKCSLLNDLIWCFYVTLNRCLISICSTSPSSCIIHCRHNEKVTWACRPEDFPDWRPEWMKKCAEHVRMCVLPMRKNDNWKRLKFKLHWQRSVWHSAYGKNVFYGEFSAFLISTSFRVLWLHELKNPAL